MKTKLILILSFVASFALADVTVTDTGRVLKDGADIGAIPDAIMNKVVAPSEVQSAVLRRLAETKAAADAKAAEADKAKADANTKAEAALKRIREKKAKEESTGKGKRWEALDELEGELNVTAADIRKAELQKQIDDLREQLKTVK